MQSIMNISTITCWIGGSDTCMYSLVNPLCLFQIVSSEREFIATIRGVLHGGAIDNSKRIGLYP